MVHYTKARRARREPRRNLTPTESRLVAFLATIALAGVAIATQVKEPVVWAFLLAAITHTLAPLGKAPGV